MFLGFSHFLPRNRRARRLLAVAASLAGVHLHSPTASAITTNWINNSGGTFTTATNWDNGVPDGDDTAIFNRGSVAYAVTLPGYLLPPSPGNHVIQSLFVKTNEVLLVNSPSIIYKGPRGLTATNGLLSVVVGDSGGDVAILNTSLNNISGVSAFVGRLSGATGTLNVLAGTFSMSNSLTVGSEGIGTMTIQGGADVSNADGYIARFAGAEGVVNVRGIGSTWTNQDLRVGTTIPAVGTGTLTIEDGGLVTSTNGAIASSSSVNVTGAGSGWDQSGALSIAQQALLTISSGGHVANTQGSISGTVNVSGTGSVWDQSGALSIAQQGSLTISNGGHVTNAQGSTSGSVNVSGAASVWDQSGALTMNAGSLTIADGGRVNAASGSITLASATVTGAGSAWVNSTTLEVGYGSTLTISGGALVSNTSANVGTHPSTPGQVTVSGAGSTWTNSGDLVIGGNSTLSAATVTVSEGGAVSAGGSVLIGPLGMLAGNGAVTAAVINHGRVRSGSQVAGSSSNTLRVNGSYVQAASGTLVMVLRGTTQGSYSQLQASGAVSLDGRLEVNLSNFQPVPGDRFDILDWGSLSGTFSAVVPQSLGLDRRWNLSQLYTTGVISVIQSPAEWAVNTGGSWAVANNWSAVFVPNHATAGASFLNRITAPSTVTLDGNKTVASLTFSNFNSYTIAPGSGGTLTIGDGTSGIIEVYAGAHVISAPLAFAGYVEKSGPGILTISGTQNHPLGSSLSVTDGKVNLNSNLGAPASAADSSVAHVAISVSSNGGIELSVDQDLRGLQISVSDAGPQRFDLHSPITAGGFRSVRVYAADLTAAKANLYNAIKNALATGAADPTDGIYDSSRGLHTNSGVGLALVNDAHGDPNVFIRLTRIGDLNLDGQVTISDFIDLASHFNSPGTWQEGDLNYDGQVTISDFIDLASNFNSNYAGEIWPISPADQQALSTFAASVPEPNVIFAVVAFSLSTFASRRRRR